MQRNVFSAFNPSFFIKEQWAAVKQLGVQCLAQGHFNLQQMGRAGIEPATLGLQDDPLTPLGYGRPTSVHTLKSCFITITTCCYSFLNVFVNVSLFPFFDFQSCPL